MVELPTALAGLKDALAAATPVETAIVAGVLASLFLLYFSLTRCVGGAALDALIGG